MLQLPVRSGRPIAPPRAWKAANPDEAARLIPSGAVVAVEWLSEDLAAAMDAGYRREGQPRDLTVVYATARGPLRGGGLHRIARAGLVRRVIGGQWYPVLGLQALAKAAKIEAYSLPSGVIRRLFRDIADGLPGHLSRSGLGTFADPRRHGGRLTRGDGNDLVFLVQAAGTEALLYRTFPIDVAVVSVSLIAPAATLAMTREALQVAQAARASGGMVIAQAPRVGLLERLPRGLTPVADATVDILVTPDTSRSA